MLLQRRPPTQHLRAGAHARQQPQQLLRRPLGAPSTTSAARQQAGLGTRPHAAQCHAARHAAPAAVPPPAAAHARGQHLQQQQQQSLAAASCSRLPARGAPGSSSTWAAKAYRDEWGSGSSGGGGGDSPPPPFSPGDLNPVEALKRELGMQSNQLDPKLREQVEAAVARCGYRVTVGQVAASAGVKLSEADRALKALAYDSLANLEVSQAGEVVYAFEPDFVSRIRRRSWLQRLRPLWRRAVAGANYLARLAFGTALIASALVVWLGVVALMSSSGRDDNRRDSYGGPRGYVFIDPTDFLLIWDPYYGRHSRARADAGGGMTFVEAIFSFVFGDGDPNEGFEERRWRTLGAHIQRLGGVLSAEEMAPFLDPPRLRRGGGGGGAFPRGAEKYEDESFVLPALIRFNGEPFVDEGGRLLYRFPDLQVVAGGSSRGAPQVRLTAAEARVPLEREWDFSAASPGQQAGALLLGLVNVVGVVTLSSLLLDPIAKLSLYRQGLGFILGLLPYLQTYAAAFFALPFIRVLVDGRRNAAIQERNDGRVEAVSLLQSGDPELAAKSAAARKLGGARVIGRSDIVYTTETATDAQANAREEEEFDSRLGGGRGARDSGQQQRAALPEGRANRIDDVFGRRRERRQEQREREQQRIEVDWDGQQQQQRWGRRRQQQQQDDWDRLDRW